MAALAAPSRPEVSAEGLSRIRRAIGYLTDPGDISEFRRAAEREVQIAESAGDAGRLAFCRAIVAEATTVAEAGSCITEDQDLTTTAHPRPFRF